MSAQKHASYEQKRLIAGVPSTAVMKSPRCPARMGMTPACMAEFPKVSQMKISESEFKQNKQTWLGIPTVNQ